MNTRPWQIVDISKLVALFNWLMTYTWPININKPMSIELLTNKHGVSQSDPALTRHIWFQNTGDREKWLTIQWVTVSIFYTGSHLNRLSFGNIYPPAPINL